MHTTFWAPADTVAGDSLHWSHLDRDRSEHYGKTVAITPIDLACWSDYSGSLACQSNARVLLADKQLAPFLVSLVGSHGSQGVAYLGTAQDPPEKLHDALCAMADCVLIDDEDHSSLEMEREFEAWESDGDSDFRRALARLFAAWADDAGDPASFDLDAIPVERMREIWDRGCDALNVNGGSGYVNECGDAIHFYIDEWTSKAGQDPASFWSDYARGAATSLRADLIALAAECRIPE